MKLVFPRLYVVLDAALLRTSAQAFAVMLAESGVELIQYRDKFGPSDSFLALSQELVAALRPKGTCLIVNDRPDVAALSGAGGVHVGQDDLPVEDARRICGPRGWVGLSTHSEEQVREAAGTSADYVAVGPIYPTTTKQRAGRPVGLDLVRQARAITPKTLVAIGGITLDRVCEVFHAGADCVAVAGDILTHAEPGARARKYLQVAAELWRN